MAQEELKVIISADTSDFEKGVGDSKKGVEGLESTSTSAGSKMGASFKKVATVLGTVFAVKKIVDFGGACISSASDVEEMENKFDVVFNGMQDEVDQWAETFANAIGRNKNNIKTYLADNQNMFVGMGMTREKGAELSEQMVSLALDLASFNNINEDDAVHAMSKALMGESESAKSLGAVLNDNTRAMAMEKLGYQGKYTALTEAQKMEVNYQAILMQSADAVGDCERSLDSYNGRQIQLNSSMQTLKETIGAALLPIMTTLTSFLNEAVTGITNFISAVLQSEQIQEICTTLSTLFNSIKDAVLGAFSGGGESCINFQTVFSEVWTGIQDIWNSIGIPLFEVIKSGLSLLAQFFKDNWGTIQTAVKTCFDYIKTYYDSILKPVFDLVISIVKKVLAIFKENMPAITSLFKSVVTTISTQWNTNLKPVFEAIKGFITNVLKPAFDAIFTYGIAPIVKTAFDNIKGFWNNSLKPIFEGICSFLSGVFTGNWKKIFEGLGSIVKGVFGGLAETMKAPFRAVANLWNKSVGSLSFTIPDWVPGVGGKGWSVPKIPAFATGGMIDEAMLGMVGEAGREAIIPIDQDKGALQEIANLISSKWDGSSNVSNRPINLILQVDKTTLGKIAIDSISKYANQQGVIPVY